ncbi:sulfatase-like hydrolase/transferase [Haloprofundus halobius]|uniref:sulfatase-like hydrolase/transferase n=1 Tax=Haloprofundus halobius TaxID=2876194 RepID=UPI001CCD2BA3|nr:sulfatase-like hydrolase/transferase [Haloprofundus halobius]
MKLLFVSIDSLCRHFLDVYEPSVDLDVETENLDRFAERAAVFDSHYAGSLPCMPARREWLTGTQEFLWRPWGPIEPFDTTVPRALREREVVTKLVTDHYHHFQHGSGGYYEDFNGFEFIRGHEYDAWKTAPREPSSYVHEQLGFAAPDDPLGYGYLNPAQYSRNVDGFEDEAEFFGPKVFAETADWLRRNDEWDEWFCYVDSFDVHEPFHLPEPYASVYTDEDPRDPDLTFWPPYGRTDRGESELSERELDFVRSQFAGKLTMVDRWFGRVLDALDELALWDETMVVVTADHGFYLGEHSWVGKPFEAPLYDVLAHTPLFVWHPDAKRTGERVDALTAAVDLNATLLDAFGAEEAAGPHSRSLLPLLDGDVDAVREWALYGYWGSSVNITDGEFTYLHPCDDDVDSYCHSTQMMNPHSWFTPPKPQPDAESGEFLPYADAPVWRYAAPSYSRHDAPLLFDTRSDPWQEENVADDDVESDRMRDLLVTALNELDAPAHQYDRLALSAAESE